MTFVTLELLGMHPNFVLMHFKDNILLYTIVPLTLLFVVVSFYRFMVILDYQVSYEEGACDPYIESCFVYCEDDECTDPYYYSIISRKASTLVELCGDNLTECDEAYACTIEEENCSITFCDPSSGNSECESLTEDDFILESTSETSNTSINNSIV